MTRGSTPTFTFSLPCEVDHFVAITSTFSQNGNVILTKEKNDLLCDGKSVSFIMSADESLLFSPKYPVEIQLIITTSDGIIWVSGIKKTTVRRNIQDC